MLELAFEATTRGSLGVGLGRMSLVDGRGVVSNAVVLSPIDIRPKLKLIIVVHMMMIVRIMSDRWGLTKALILSIIDLHYGTYKGWKYN